MRFNGLSRNLPIKTYSRDGVFAAVEARAFILMPDDVHTQSFRQVAYTGLERSINGSAVNSSAAQGGAYVDDLSVLLVAHSRTKHLTTEEERFQPPC
jgi:hypothetical protein